MISGGIQRDRILFSQYFINANKYVFASVSI